MNNKTNLVYTENTSDGHRSKNSFVVLHIGIQEKVFYIIQLTIVGHLAMTEPQHPKFIDNLSNTVLISSKYNVIKYKRI